MSCHETAITRDQIVALQTLYSQWEKHSVQCCGDSRATRLAWASECAGHPVSSFSDLSCDEARRLIDVLKGSLGQAVNQTANPWRRIRSRDRAQTAGTSGRRGGESPVIQMASPDDLARVDEMVRRLEWTPEQFNGWLKSSRSPLGATDQVVIRTTTQANRIYWALKAMLIRAGKWQGSSRRRAPTKESGGELNADVR